MVSDGTRSSRVPAHFRNLRHASALRTEEHPSRLTRRMTSVRNSITAARKAIGVTDVAAGGGRGGAVAVYVEGDVKPRTFMS